VASGTGVLLVRLRQHPFRGTRIFETTARRPARCSRASARPPANTQPWVIVFFHHPPTRRAPHSDTEIELVEMRRTWCLFLENFGRRPVLSGHSHSYEPAFLIDGHYRRPTTFGAAMKKDGGSGRPDASGAYQKPTYSMPRTRPPGGHVHTVAGTAGHLGGARSVIQRCTVAGRARVPCSGLLGKPARRDVLDSTGVRRDYFSIVKGVSDSRRPRVAFGARPLVIPGLVSGAFDEAAKASPITTRRWATREDLPEYGCGHREHRGRGARRL